MKRLATVMMLIGLIAFTPIACAYSNVGGQAIVDDGKLYVSAIADDGETQIISAVDTKTGEARQIYLGSGYLLAADDGYVLASVNTDDDEFKTVLVKDDGTLIFDGDFDSISAVCDDGVFYADGYEIRVSGDKAESKKILEGTDCYPVRVEDGFLYYNDDGEYGKISAMEGGGSTSALCRVNLKTGESQRLTGDGATLLDVDDGFITYSLDDFYILDGDDTKLVNVERGVYRARDDGSDAVKIIEMSNNSDSSFEQYLFVDDNVVYGVNYDYESDDPVPLMWLKRNMVSGEALDDIEVEFGQLIGIEDGEAYIAHSVYTDDYERMEDQITAVNVKTGEKRTVLTTEMEIVYYETGPQIAIDDDNIYFAAFETESDEVDLWSVSVKGSEPVKLARIW